MPLKIGIVGLGYMGQIHLRKLLSFDDVRVVCVEIDREKIRSIEGTFGVRVYEDFRKIEDRLDGVIIATPPETHIDIASFFVKRGIPCFVEKPLALSVEEAKDFLKLANQFKVTVQVGFLERYNPAFLKAIDLMDDPILFQAERFGVYSERCSNIDVVMDLMLHDIDLFTSIFTEEVECLDALGFGFYGSKFDEAYATVTLKGGKRGIFRASRIWGSRRRNLMIMGRKKVIRCDLLGRELEVESDGISETFDFNDKIDPVEAELNDFLLLLREGKRPKVTLDEALDSLFIARKILDRIEGK